MKFFKVLVRGLLSKPSWARSLDQLLMLLTIAGTFFISAKYYYPTFTETDDKFGLVVTNIFIGILILLLWVILDREKILPLVKIIEGVKKARKAYAEVYEEIVSEEYRREAQSGDISIAEEE